MAYSRRRERAPKPLSVPIVGALVGVLLVVLAYRPFSSVDLAGLGLILFFWGVLSFAFGYLARRRRASQMARVRQ